ncbi:MAG TPA: glycosyltransferase [Gemmatimonadales bacterium]|nr:glycosyltransferase [Gemmatimonadales bacterium]
MRVGFVFTNYNNSSFTREAIASLRAGTRWPETEVVIVDNRSNETDVAALREMTAGVGNVTLLLNPENVGYFPGLNIGLRHLRQAHPDLAHVVVGNNDLVFPPDFVETVQRSQDLFEKWAVIAPDLVTLDGVHQNPHVLYPFGRLRWLLWELYYLSYPGAMLMVKAARALGGKAMRAERAPDSELFKTPRPILMGIGACYLLGPLFFQHFAGLCAPTFLMAEEAFLAEQLKTIGQQPYYDPRFRISHHDHGTMDTLPGRWVWNVSRDGYRMYRRYLAMTRDDQLRFISDHIGVTA